MFEWFSKKDHDTVKELFDRFESEEGLAGKKKIVTRAIEELKTHAAIEEEIFYPAVRKQIGDTDLMNEADEEHHVVKVLIAELEKMDGHEEHYSAKFTVLAENVRHHIKEEEGEMLPKARSLDLDFRALGEQMLERKRELKNGAGRRTAVSGAKTSAKKTSRPARKRKAA